MPFFHLILTEALAGWRELRTQVLEALGLIPARTRRSSRNRR